LQFDRSGVRTLAQPTACWPGTLASVIRAVLCDFDGVIRRWSANDIERIETAFSLPLGAVAEAAFSRELLHEATTGAISDEEWRERIAGVLVAQHGNGAHAAVAAWSRLSGSLDHEMLQLLREVRTTASVVLVTNATTRLDRDLEALAVGDAFDAIANSSALGVVKPQAEIFERAAASVGGALADCVVIDDQPGHLRAAHDAGASIIHHTAASETRSALAALGLPLG
jgi:putative hydrolase of the HAD superfamily